ncbi:MAG: helix-turn-helix transcriptional regulator [Pseudomonadota bacterium]
MTYADHLDPQDDYSEATATFGDRIVAARDAMGMTSAQLARRLGIRPQTLTSWEHDRSEPRANKLQMLAGVLNVSMIWLMSGDGPGVRTRAQEDGENGTDWQALIDELREIRDLQGDLTARTLRLERRLLALAE